MSEAYIVSARKYRPSTFASVVGQSALTRTLKNAIGSGRLAQAYLFCGPRGVGKTSCARIFAKTINCEHRTVDGEACGKCDSCRDFERGVSYNVIELDAASNNGVDHMRSLTEQVNVPPATGSYRVFIIDEVHMLSTGAFNAFLKTLEEPPSYAIFILATTEKNKVLPTILSRCQTYDFARITEHDIAMQLRRVADAEGISAEDAALEVIARKADGAMRDALSIFDQVAAAGAGNLTYNAAIENLNVLDYDVYFRFTDAFAAADVPTALLLYHKVLEGGFDARFFVNGLGMHLRNLLVAQTPATASLIEASERAVQRYVEVSAGFDAPWYYKALELVQDCDLNFREALDKQLLVELALIRLCRLRAPVDAVTPPTAPPVPTMGTPLTNTPPAPPAPATSTSPRPATADTTSAQPAVVHRPMPSQPAHIARPPRAGIRGNSRSLHLNNVGKREADTQQEQPSHNTDSPTSDTPEPATQSVVDPTLLQKAWNNYIAANSDKKLLLTAMRRELPEHIDGCRYELRVDNQAQLQEAENHITELAEYLRQVTGNAALSLSVREQAPAERPRHLSPAEALTEMIRRNPAAGSLLTLIDAEQI